MKNKKEIILSDWKNNKGGFKTPANYFEEFEDNFQNSKNAQFTGYAVSGNYFSKVEDKIIHKTIKVRATGFHTPDNYFNELENSVINKLSFSKTKIINIKRSVLITLFAVAASLLLFFGLNDFLFNKNEYNIETIQIAEIENWIDEDLISFNSYEINDTFNDVELVIENDYSDVILEYLDYTDVENLIIED